MVDRIMTPTGRAFDLAGLVQVQPGAVVSRTLVDRKAGSLTVFAFDRGQGLNEHTSPYEATVMILEGEAHITIDGAEQRVGAGRTIILPAHRPHALRAGEPFKMLLVMIRD